MAAATLSVGVLLAILEAAPEIRVPFRVDSHHSSKLGGKSQGGRRDQTSRIAKVRNVSASLWIAPQCGVTAKDSPGAGPSFPLLRTGRASRR
jgi:hypothetical protein